MRRQPVLAVVLATVADFTDSADSIAKARSYDVMACQNP